MFDATEIRNACSIEHVEVHEELASTNDRALELVRSNKVSDSAIIVARMQSAGRGQRARSWWSSDESLTFTWIKKFDSKGVIKDSSGILPIVTAIAVATAIESLTDFSSIKIKWPNDVLVANRKLAGILIETVNLGTELALVVGIGVNVNHAQFPEVDSQSGSGVGACFPPTSIRLETGKEAPLQSLLIMIIQRLSSELDKLSNPDNSEIIAERCNQRLAFMNEPVVAETANGETVSGKCMGVSTDGSLTVQTEEAITSIHSGTLRPAHSNN